MKMEDMVIISSDDHVCEPPNMFDNVLSGSLLASAPKNLSDKNGNSYWLYQGNMRGLIGLNAVVGRPYEEYGMEPTSFEQLRKGSYDVHARIDDMDVKRHRRIDVLRQLHRLRRSNVPQGARQKARAAPPASVERLALR